MNLPVLPQRRFADQSETGRPPESRRQTAGQAKRRARSETAIVAAVFAVAVLTICGLLIATETPSHLVQVLAEQSGPRLNVLATFALLAFMAGFASLVRKWSDTLKEVSRWRRAHARARAQSTRDPLTGLPNRRRLKAELALALARVRRGRHPVGLLMLNLDGFSHVNAVHGTRAGDLLLHAVGQRIRASVREIDIVAHVAGDEFAVVAELRRSDDASVLAERLNTEMRLSFDLAGVEIWTSCRIGIAVAPEDGALPDLLLQRATMALAGTCDQTPIRYYEQGMNDRVRQRAELQSALGDAVAGDRIVLHYQPMVDLETRRIRGFEALARWWQPSRGLVSPSEFIPAAEASGLIGRLTDNLLRQACIAARAWPNELIVSVNLAPTLLRDREFPVRVRDILRETGLSPDRLELEIAEAALAENLDEAKIIAAALKGLGVRLALDDFGTGYSSLRYIQAIQFDKIKIDAPFVRSVGSSDETDRIVSAVISLGNSLNIPTVAEGVETEAEAEAMQKLGCTLAQGYWFGRPIPPEGVDSIFAGAQ